LHEYPKGQHLSPQRGNVLVSAVVFTGLRGCLAASCRETSQPIVFIFAQSDPLGQQRRVVLPAKAMQVCSVGQQKLAGNDAKLQLE